MVLKELAFVEIKVVKLGELISLAPILTVLYLLQRNLTCYVGSVLRLVLLPALLVTFEDVTNSKK